MCECANDYDTECAHVRMCIGCSNKITPFCASIYIRFRTTLTIYHRTPKSLWNWRRMAITIPTRPTEQATYSLHHNSSASQLDAVDAVDASLCKLICITNYMRIRRVSGERRASSVYFCSLLTFCTVKQSYKIQEVFLEKRAYL